MMYKSLKMTFCLALFLFAFLCMASPFDLEQLTAIRPGDLPSKDLKLIGSLPEAKYKIKLEGKQIKSVSIELRKPIASETFLKLETKGFCLSQIMSPDIPMKKYFLSLEEILFSY